MRQPELLAPAGSPACVTAAVRCGADAVYLGTKAFNARRGAENFDDAALREAVAYCHARGVKVHITLNTLVSDAELPAAQNVIQHVCALGADVLILQDLGLAALAKAAAPDLGRHASTQMSVQTPQGVALLKALGFSRVVLPRELTAAEIKDVRAATDLEIEVFIHGAQCMCVSGQCLMSAVLGSRSGNRGLCAQPCRLAFSAGQPGRHDLSLKDLSLIGHLQELTALGVDAFKIEGRMKRPEYVAAAVTSARAALNGSPDAAADDALRAVFSRSGFTDGYFQNRRGPDMFGIRTKEDVTAASNKVLSSLAHLYDKEQPRVPVDFFFSLLTDEPPALTAKAGGKTVFVTADTLPQPARTTPLTAEALDARLSKCGGTPFFRRSFDCALDDGLMLPASVINDLRRRALDQLEQALSVVKPVPFTDRTELLQFSTLENRRQTPNYPPKFHVFVADSAQIPRDLTNVENLFLPLESAEKSVEIVKNCPVPCGVHLPRGIFGNYNRVKQQLLQAKANGYTAAYCPTLDALALAKDCGMDLFAGFSLHIFNSAAAAVLNGLDVKAITLSPELTEAQAKNLVTSVPKGIYAYGRLPLMLTRNCPIRNVKSCADCKNQSDLTDRLGVRFPVRCRSGCSEVLNSRPIYLADRPSALQGFDFIELHFTTEDRAAADEILARYRDNRAFDGSFTRGLLFRGVD